MTFSETAPRGEPRKPTFEVTDMTLKDFRCIEVEKGLYRLGAPGVEGELWRVLEEEKFPEDERTYFTMRQETDPGLVERYRRLH